MYIVIVGGGKVGYHLAKALVANKHAIALIEEETDKCKEIAEELKDVLVINGDGCDLKYLEEAGIKRADVLAAVTGEDENNLIICQLGKEYFQVPRTVARVNNPKNEKTFSELGVDVPVNSTSIIAKIIEEEASMEDFVTLLTFKRGKLAIVRIDLTENSPVVGKAVKEVKLPEDAVLVSLVRGEQVIIPKGDTILQEKDDVIALTTIEKEREVLDLLAGKIEV